MLIMEGPLVPLESCRVFEQIIAFDLSIQGLELK
jgi:hypothetical protein